LVYKLGCEWDERGIVVLFPAEAGIYLLFSSRISIADRFTYPVSNEVKAAWSKANHLPVPNSGGTSTINKSKQ